VFNFRGKAFVFWGALFLFLIGAFNLYQRAILKPVDSLDYSRFVSELSNNQVAKVLIRGQDVAGVLKNGTEFITHVPYQDIRLMDRLMSQNVKISSAPPLDPGLSLFQLFMMYGFPVVSLIAFLVFFFRQMQGGTGRALGFGKSRARLVSDKTRKVTFADVAGIDEAKEDLEEIVDFLRNPPKFQKLGGKIPKGVLLVGPPGTGKTLLARAIAGEASVPFFSISGSDFVELFVGLGASRVRDMFEQAKQASPCIIFIDEIDAVGRQRGSGLGGGNDEREQTLNQLLVEMDGLESSEGGIILIAATNRPDVLDPALLRPGRFDRQVVVANPDVTGREKILAVHMKRISMALDVDPKVVARGTPGFSGADLANLVNEAALLAARRNKRAVSMGEFEDAKDKVMMGAERRTLVMTEDDKRLTAYHESGHALVAFHSPHSDPIHKMTIVPRGQALGMVVRLPEGDRVSLPKTQLLADLAVAMGGRVAEQMIFTAERITTGASSDIRKATEIARRMVTEWGMSDLLGPVAYGDVSREVFIGHTIAQNKPISEVTAQEIDREIRRIVEEAYQRAFHILQKHIDQLHLLATELLKRETLTGQQIRVLLETGTLEETQADIVPTPPQTQKTVKRKPRVSSSARSKGIGVTPAPDTSLA
jgi:cell division protease FtsH